MVLSLTENSRVFAPNYTQNSFFSSGVSITPRPIYGIGLKWLRVKKKLTNISASSGNGGVDEKVFQFTPSFDEYLKAMESVRSGREKQGALSSSRSADENDELRDSGRKSTSGLGMKEGVDNGGLRGEKVGRNDNFRDSSGESSGRVLMKEGKDNGGLKKSKDDENAKRKGSEGTHTSAVVMTEGRVSRGLSRPKDGKKYESRDSPRRSSDRIMMKQGRYYGGLRSKMDDENVLRDSPGGSYDGILMKEDEYDSGFGSKINDGKLQDSGGKNTMLVVMKGGKKNGDLWSQKNGRSDNLRDSGSFFMKERRDNGGLRRAKDCENAERKSFEGKIYNRIMIREGKDDFGLVIAENEKLNDNKFIEIEKVRKLTNESIIDEGLNGEEVSDMERAAFKPLKELEDVYAKRRITRAEMEERIQKLAKCLNGADIDMPEWMFTKTMRSAEIRFSDHSMLRLIQILGKLGNWKRVLQVIEWIQLRERFKSHKLRYIYTAALNVLGKSRRPVEALNLFNLMLQQMSSYPDLVAYHCIAVTLGQAGHMKELFYVMDTMQSPPKKKFSTGVLEKWDPRLEPDIVVYNAVLNACVHRKKWEGAFWVLQQLKQQGQQPSTTTYGLVMEVMLACGKYNLVHEFFRKVQKICIPNALTYKVLLNTLWKEGKIDEAILAVEDMERRGIVGTASLYYDLARCLCSAGRCEEALLQIDKLCKVANKPLVVTYTGLIQTCIESGRIDKAAFIFKHMQNFCSPNLVTYNIMLKAFLDGGKFKEAKELFLTVLGDRKATPDLYTFNVMLDACAAEQKWEDVELAYVNMLKYGYHFNAKRHLQIVLAGCSAGKEGLVEKTWAHLARGDKVPPAQLIGAMFGLKLGEGDLVEALSCFACHPSIEARAFSRKWWLKLLQENKHRLEKHTLFKLMQAADSMVVRSDAQKLILDNLRISCEEFLTEQMKVDEHDSSQGTMAAIPSQTALV